MRWLLVLAMLGGCYAPSIQPCRLACNGQSCPDGLACNGQGMCAEDRNDVCGGPGTDGGPGDGSEGDAPPCMWGAVANVDACAQGAHLATYDLAVTATIDTDDLTSRVPQDLPLTVIQQTASPRDAVLLTLRTLDLGAASRIDVRGSRPLIILVDGAANVAGSIVATPSYIGACIGKGAKGGAAPSGTRGAGGGGGGSHGDFGARGGVGGSSGSPGANGGLAAPQLAHTAELAPIAPGCAGGPGGGNSAANDGGAGGAGGGAIQLAARDALEVSGVVIAGGGSGGPGGTSGAGIVNGGGGGGAGGAIFLQAPTLRLTGARLCANGGGGGAGGGAGASGGVAGSCDATSAGGTIPSSPVGHGGDGAAQGTTTPSQGLNGVAGTPAGGGGGGGGGFGRIRLEGMIATEPMLSTPMYTTPPP